MKIELSAKADEWKRDNVCLVCAGKEDLFFIEFSRSAWGNFCKGCIVAIHSLTSPLSVLVCTGKDIYESSVPPKQQESKVS